MFSPKIMRLFCRLPFSFEPCKNMDSEARWHSTSQFVLPPDYPKILVYDRRLLCLPPGCRGGLYLSLQDPLEYFPWFCELWLFLMEISHLFILVGFVQMLALLDGTNNSLYSSCYILSDRNAILSVRISILSSILILRTHYLRGYFIC